MSFRTRLVSIVGLTAVAATLTVAGVAAPPASADGTLHPLAAIGSIESIAVEYSDGDDRPGLHIVGWAGDLNQPGSNGDASEPVGLELYLPGAGGSTTTLAWAENWLFDYPRPDIAARYGLGPNQGFEVHALAPQTGPVTVCLRLYSFYTYPESTSGLSCATVNVPATRPAYHPVLTGSARVGSTLSVALSSPSGGSDSYSWGSYQVVGTSAPNPHNWWNPGPAGTSFTTTLDLIGHSVRALVRTVLPGIVIEQSSAELQVTPPILSSERVASTDRYATSVAASQKAHPDGSAAVPVAYIASGGDFPDALSAGAAAAKLRGTLLLTPPGGLDTRVAAELVRLHPARIVVVGGTTALSDQVVTDLKALPFATTVDRISGADRYAVSRQVVADAFGASIPDLYLVTGAAFPDALAAAAAAASTGRPVLLTDGRAGALDPGTATALHDWGTTHVTIVGGPASVSTGIEGSLAAAGIAVTRTAGADRFGTAAALARTFVSHTAYFVNGLMFPDALSTAVLAATQPGPLLLTLGYCAPTASFSGFSDSHATHAVIVGGPAVQDYQVLDYGC